MLSPKLALELKTKWEAKKALLKKKFPQLTEADLDYDENRKNQMYSNLQLKTGRTIRELQDIIEIL
jgi:hypothetical protein